MPRPGSRLGRRAIMAGGLAALATPRLAHAGKLAITDAIGRTVHLDRPAERIVLGFNYEEYTAITGPAGWDRVVGFSRALWADWRPSVFRRYREKIPRLDHLADVGNTDENTFSLEKVISLRPDLVILAGWSFSVLGQAVAQMQALGIPVLVIDYNAQTVARHVASTLAMGAATGNTPRARELAALYAGRVADIRRRAAQAAAQSSAAKPKSYVELGQGGADVIGNTYWKTMWGRILDIIGAANIAAGHIPGAWGPLNPEFVLSANPDAIFIAGSSWVNHPNAVLTGFDADLATTRARLAPYAHRKGWPELAAIRNGQLHAIEHGLCRALFDYTAMYYIAQQVFPEQFADIDPVAELRRYHDQYLPVHFEGTWMARAA